MAEWIESLGRPEDHAEMLAYHWRSALDLARAAGDADDELVRRARLALRDAGDRAFALNSFAAAAALYEDALALWPNEDSGRPELLFSRARALHYAYDDRREEALDTARDALLAVGDTDRAAEAEALLGHISWYQGQGEATRRRLGRAVELAGDSVSPSAARVLAISARMREIASEHDAGIVLAQSALAMAETLGLHEIRAHALATIGMAKSYLGDTSGVQDMEQALELALRIDSPVAGPIVNNLAVEAFLTGDLERAEELYAESIRVGKRVGNLEAVRFTEANQVWMDFMLGRWDVAVRRADEFIAACDAGAPHANEYAMRIIRGSIRLARGDPDSALTDHLRSLDLARASGEPGDLIPTLAASATTRVYRGELDEARVLAEEVIRLVRETGIPRIIDLAPVADRLGLRERLRDAVDAHPLRRAVVWRDATSAALRGDLVEAAEIISRTGNVTWEAVMRLHAGEQLAGSGRRAEGEGQLRSALEFYRSVQASYFVERIELLLSHAQSASA